MLPVFRMDGAPSPGVSEHSSYFSDASENTEAPHGQWVTDPPYTLPAGSDHCPVPTCPSRGRKFKPYWRLNEHMKTKHGWPRRTISPTTDRRLGNTFRADHHKKTTSGLTRELGVGDTTTTVDDEDTEMPDAENDDSIISRPRRSGAKKDYSRMFNDPYAAGIPVARADKQSLLVTLKVRAPLTPRSKHRHSISHHSASSLPENPFSPASPSTSKSTPVVPKKLDEIDEMFIHEAKAYLSELELGHIHFPLASTAAELEASLRHVLASNSTPSTASLIRINTMLTPENSSALRPIYHALAHRANSIASSSAAASPVPSTPQRRNSSMSSGTSVSPPNHAGYGDLAMAHFASGGPRRSSSNATNTFAHVSNFRPIAPRTSPPLVMQHQLPLEHPMPALAPAHAQAPAPPYDQLTPPQPHPEAPATFTFSGPRTRPFEWEVEREKREGEGTPLVAKPKERVGERERRRVKEREMEKQRERGRQVLGTPVKVVTPEVKRTGLKLVLKLTPGSVGGGKGVGRVREGKGMGEGGMDVDRDEAVAA